MLQGEGNIETLKK